MGNQTPVLAGSWKENSGRLWHCSQNGNIFTWTQEGTGRVATGSLVSTSVNPGLTGWSIHITFDGNVHWRLNASSDGTVLNGKSDTFRRVTTGTPIAPASTYNLSGVPSHSLSSALPQSLNAMHPNMYNAVFRENSGKTWAVQSQHAGYLVLKNQQDGRRADVYMVRDVSAGKYTIFIDFQGSDTPFRVETYNISEWPLANGDSFKCSTPITMPGSLPIVQPNVNSSFSVSIGSSGVNFGVQPTYVPPTTSYVPPPQPFSNQPVYIQPNTTYIPPQQSYIPPQQSYNPNMNMSYNPQVMGVPPQQPYGVTTSMYPTTQTYGVSLANSIIQACQGKSFDSDKIKAVTTYSQSQVSPVSGAELVKIISMFSFDSDKFKAIHQLRTTNNIAGLDCATTTSVLRCFAHDSDKVKAIHELCTLIWDRRQNAESIVNCFSFSSDQSKIREYLFQH